MNCVYICDAELNSTFSNMIMTMLFKENIRVTNLNVSKRSINYYDPFIFILNKDLGINSAIDFVNHYISKNKILWFKHSYIVTNFVDHDLVVLRNYIKAHFGYNACIYSSERLDTSLGDIIIDDIIYQL